MLKLVPPSKVTLLVNALAVSGVLVMTVAGAGGAWATDKTGASTNTISFVRDVLPILSKAGCNAGSCHARAEGQNGFKLSVFAYDPKADYHEIVHESRGRRVSAASPEQSLVLKKPTMLVGHQGGQRFEIGSPSYQTILSWVKQGMPYQVANEAELVAIKVSPAERQYTTGAVQQLSVAARYSDGSTRDVTALTEFSSTEKDIARVEDHGLVTVGPISGEGIIVSRYMGLVDISRVTVPAERRIAEAAYAALSVRNPVDEHAYRRFQKLGILPSAACSDWEFLRRASLDAMGRLPSAEETRTFLADENSDKRDRWIDHALASPAYADYWATKWGDLIRPNPARVGVKSVYLIDLWLRECFRQNKPYDRMVRELLTAQGSTHRYAPAVVFRDHREPADAGAFVSQIFLGVRLECAKCHHHPNEKWSQADYYQMGAFFAEVKRKGQGISAPISGNPEYIFHAPGGQLKHPVTGEVMPPKPPDGTAPTMVKGRDPRNSLADWMARSDNPFFARAVVNRIWGEYMGRGLVHPVDDFRASNPPVNEQLLQWLAEDFVQHGFDLKHTMRTIMQSRVYQQSTLPNETNVGDTRNFSRSYRRRLPAEVLLDAVCDFTQVPDKFDGTVPGTRAVQTWNVKLDSDFMDAFGRPNSSAECPCERDRQTSVVQALHLMNSNRLQTKLAHKEGRVAHLANSSLGPEEIVKEVYLAAYCRWPTAEELRVSVRAFEAKDATRQTATEDIVWSLINSAEFVFNH